MKFLLQLGGVFSFLSVAIGAFGAHSLKARLTELGTLETFETAVRYQMFHSIAIFLCAILMGQFKELDLSTAAYSFAAGILIFSGSLYILSLTGIKWLGAITPLGGVAFLLGWGLFIWQASKLTR
jgi:uncharacterized membrane protein YgdD (TMEM256/DUF423 family)